MNGEEREFRIYVESRGAEPVVRDICGEKDKDLAVAIVRAWFPNDYIHVREVLETAVETYPPAGSSVGRPRS